jgi:hypothetical protein
VFYLLASNAHEGSYNASVIPCFICSPGQVVLRGHSTVYTFELNCAMLVLLMWMYVLIQKKKITQKTQTKLDISPVSEPGRYFFKS